MKRQFPTNHNLCITFIIYIRLFLLHVTTRDSNLWNNLSVDTNYMDRKEKWQKAVYTSIDFFLSFVEKLTNECLSCEFSHKIILKHILLTSVALLQADVSIVHKYFKKLLQDKRYNLFQKSSIITCFFLMKMFLLFVTVNAFYIYLFILFTEEMIFRYSIMKINKCIWELLNSTNTQILVSFKL